MSTGVSSLTSIGQTRISAARLAIIESHGAKGDLLKYYCANCWGFELVALERTGHGGAEAVTRTKPDLVLAGLTPADVTPVNYVNLLRRAAPSSKLILLAAQCLEYPVHLIMPTDFQGLIFDADESLNSMEQAIESIRAGFRYVSPRIAACQTAMRTGPTSFHKLLSRREQEVLVCIAHSFSDAEIGTQLGLSSATALVHRRQIMRKLSIHSTPKLIRYAMEKGFNAVPPPNAAKSRSNP